MNPWNEMETTTTEETESANRKPKNWVSFDTTKDNNNRGTSTNEGNQGIESIMIQSSSDMMPSVVATIEPSHSIQMNHPLTTPTVPSDTTTIQSFSNQSYNPSHGHDTSIMSRSVSPLGTTKSNGVPSPDTIRSRSEPVEQNQAINSSRPTSLQIFDSRTRGNNRRFKNGDIVVSLLPLNSSCAWVTPASFRPQLVPEELMEPSLTLTVEDYVQAMTILTNDFRFKLYTIAYKRVIFFWISLGFILLLSLLFSGARGLTLFCGGLLWLIMNALGIFICIWIKFKLYRQLENCISSVNESLLMKHNLLLGVDDRGHLSCHKINLYFIYFNLSDCTNFLNQLLDTTQSSNPSASANGNSTISGRLPPVDITNIDIENGDVIITGPSTLFRSSEFGPGPDSGQAGQTTVVHTNSGSTNTTIGQQSSSRTISMSASKRTQRLIARYSQRWVKEFVRKRLDLNLPLHYEATPSNQVLDPRHCASARCLCQFIEEHLRFKPFSQFSWKDLCL